jgi:hypothetical protein
VRAFFHPQLTQNFFTLSPSVENATVNAIAIGLFIPGIVIIMREFNAESNAFQFLMILNAIKRSAPFLKDIGEKTTMETASINTHTRLPPCFFPLRCSSVRAVRVSGESC